MFGLLWGTGGLTGSLLGRTVGLSAISVAAFRPSLAAVGLLVALGTGPTAVAYTLYFRGLRSAPASTAALLSLLEPLSGTILAAALDARGYDMCVPVNDDPSVTQQPLLDFSAGYVLRSIDQFPRAGSRAPWRLGMGYVHDVVTLRHGKINDGSMRFSRLTAAQTQPRNFTTRVTKSAGLSSHG